MQLLAVGLDGASPYLIEKWIDHLPNLRSMGQRGVHGVLESIVPPSSVPAWQCFATGKNPAKIGIWGFISIGRDRKVKTGRTTPDIGCIWDLASKAGLKTGVFNIPGTYPPYPVNGFMVSGFPTPPGKTWAEPEELMKRLDRSLGGYEIDVPLTKPSEMRGGEKAYLAQVKRLHLKSVEGAKLLIQWYHPDILVMTLQGIDMVQHDFWRYMGKTDSPYQSVVRDWYVRLDSAVGELTNLVGPQATILVCSDHGSLPVSTSFHVNEYLRSNGILMLKYEHKVSQRGSSYTKLRELILKTLPPDAIRTVYKMTPAGLAHKLTVSAKLERTLAHLTDNIDWDQTLAFSTGGHQAAIYVNLPSKMVKDTPETDSREKLLERVCALFRVLRHPTTGEILKPVFHFKERTFPGPYQSEAPDLCVELFAQNEKIHINPTLGSGKLWSFAPHLSAEHIRQGFWTMIGPRVRHGLKLDASILDMAPTMQRILGLALPGDLDGKPLDSILNAN